MRAIAALGLVIALGACATPPLRLLPFASDGCSLFPDRAPLGTADWCDCCRAHDLAYWRGGSAVEREQADAALRQCVLARTGDPALAAAMYAGVRAGGSPYFPTHYRWAYGWPTGRGYAPLTAPETAAAARLQHESLAAGAARVCATGTASLTGEP